MQAVKEAAKKQLNSIKGVTGFGIGGDDILIIYIKEQSVIQKLPATFQGAHINPVVTGEIRAST